MGEKNHEKAYQVLKNYPDEFSKIAFKDVILNGQRLYISVRVKPTTKPPLYLFNTEKKCFVSSLFYDPLKKCFYFDIKNKVTDENDTYYLILNKESIEIKGVA